MERMIHTPEGVRDIYNGECSRKLSTQMKIHETFAQGGYKDIETPTFEFFDVFGKEVGTTPSKDLYKFFDRDGNTLVLRPDFTPSIARAAAMYFTDSDMPLRLCYQGNTFVNRASLKGRLKESTQMGVELIGDADISADVSVIALAVDSLLAAGLVDFQISIGQVDFFKSLVEEAAISKESAEQIRELISQKNFFGVEEMVDALPMSDELKHAFSAFPQLFGSTEILDQAKSLTENPAAIAAVDRLSCIFDQLCEMGYGKYIGFDFGMLSQYQYYTGIIFQVYTYGTGEPVAKGGRYNNLLAHFGNPAPAIGFGITMDVLMNALARTKKEGRS